MDENEFLCFKVCWTHQPALSSTSGRGSQGSRPPISDVDELMNEHENGPISGPLQELRAKLNGQNDIDWNKLDKDLRKTVVKFRKKLTTAQNAQWTDESIGQAFLSLGSDPTYFAGASAKQQLLDASSKELSQDTDFLRAVAESARLHEILRTHAVMFWNAVLKHAQLAMDRGKYMTDAEKGKGLLVTGGHDEKKMSEIASHWQENQDGGGTEFENRFQAHPKQRGDFVPGSGGLQVSCGKVRGKGMESAEPIFDTGSGPGTEHDDDPHGETHSEIAEAQAQRIRERWMREQMKEAHNESPRADAAD